MMCLPLLLLVSSSPITCNTLEYCLLLTNCLLQANYIQCKYIKPTNRHIGTGPAIIKRDYYK